MNPQNNAGRYARWCGYATSTGFAGFTSATPRIGYVSFAIQLLFCAIATNTHPAAPLHQSNQAHPPPTSISLREMRWLRQLNWLRRIYLGYAADKVCFLRNSIAILCYCNKYLLTAVPPLQSNQAHPPPTSISRHPNRLRRVYPSNMQQPLSNLPQL